MVVKHTAVKLQASPKTVLERTYDWLLSINGQPATQILKDTLICRKEQFLNQVDDSNNNYRTLVNVNYGPQNHDHWVGVRDVKTINGIDYVVIDPSSINDKMTTYDVWYYYDGVKGKNYYPESREDKGWLIVKGSVYVPVSQTKGYVNFIESKKGK